MSEILRALRGHRKLPDEIVAQKPPGEGWEPLYMNIDENGRRVPYRRLLGWRRKLDPGRLREAGVKV